jgi:hypothetical protein
MMLLVLHWYDPDDIKLIIGNSYCVDGLMYIKI